MYRTVGFSAQHEMELIEIDLERLKPDAARRYQCVWMRFALGMKAPWIAKVLNLNPSTVRHIQSAFMREGAKTILGRGNWGGRRHQYMTLQEECAFLHNLPFPTTTADLRTIKQSFEKAIGKRVDASTIRRLLERHGWRKTICLCAAPAREGSSSDVPQACWPTAG